MIKTAIPLLHVASSLSAEDFYCNKLGFRKEFAYRSNDTNADPCYMGISRDGVWLHVSSFPGDGVVDDVDALHAEFAAKGVGIDLEPFDQTWGNREMYVRDADGNCLRFIQYGR
jgi:catechol 2,3-dioxygenase-like lactoylglutathione lyase family enzyme